jgi:SAM-dependent methyltransferase
MRYELDINTINNIFGSSDTYKYMAVIQMELKKMNRQRILEIPRVKFDARIINENTFGGKYSIGMATLLDVGCYDKLLRKYLNNGVAYIGIDYPEYDLEKDRLPFKNKSFDYVCCFEMLEHLVDQTNCIKEIKRVVKDDGLIFISLPNIEHIFVRYRMLFGYGLEIPYIVSKKTKHYHYGNFHQNKEFIEKNFKILKMYHLGDFHRNIKLMKMSWMANHLPNLFSYRTIFVCKKEESDV